MAGARDFLVELGTEELPPKALRSLMDSFADGMRDGLGKVRLNHGAINAFASPRRLAVLVHDLEAGQQDREVMQKGPPVSVAFDDDGKPTRAALAFADKCGVGVEALGRERSEAGEWLAFTTVERGQSAASLLPEVVRAALDALPIPRRMRWGAHAEEFVRPVHWLLMLHGEDVVQGSVLGIEAGNTTRGHRFMAPGSLPVRSPAEYSRTLSERGYVIADFAVRREKIVAAVAAEAKRAGGSPLGDDELYDEVTALTEWPVPLTGSFDPAFLELPAEVIVATLENHQRYFPVSGADGRLLPGFITLANLESAAPERVRDGNERVIRPRLADAAFFWQSDGQKRLAQRTSALKNVVYQQGLGTLHDKSMRVAALATLFAEQIGVDSAAVTRAAVLAKCDLLTGMVGEFPELQGTMGAYYARSDGESVEVAEAIGEQYLPRFAGDELPASIGGQILATADKLDTLAGIFVLGKRPTGNRDPFGLRRAALGVIRILVEKRLDVDFTEAVKAAVVQQPAAGEDHGEIREALYEFVVERLRSYFLDAGQGFSAEMFDAVRVRRPASLVDFHERLKAMADFSQLEQAVSLAAANKRTVNILRQAGVEELCELVPSLLQEDAERVLYHAMQAAEKDVGPLIDRRQYAESLRRLAELRVPVDAFFDDVMVMADDEQLRNNRLALLASLRSLFLDIADISRLTPSQD